MAEISQPLAIVADDEPALLRLLTRVLERSGRSVASIEDGTQVLQLLAHPDSDPKLLIVDAGIKPDGVEPILRVLCARPRPLQVVVISGKTLDPSTQALVDECGGVFLAKPFAPDGLMAVIDPA